MRYFLAPYIGTGRDDNPFRAVDSEEGWAMDFRPDVTVVDGFSLVASPVEGARLDPRCVDLGNDLDAKSVVSRIMLGNRLSVSLDADQIRRILPELLIVHSGLDRWAPLRPSNGKFDIWFGGEKIWEMHAVRGGSSFSDDFNRADSTNLGANWTETASDAQIVSNTLRCAALDAVVEARTTVDLATNDNEAEVVTVALGDIVTFDGRSAVCCRFSSAARTNYHHQWSRVVSVSPNYSLCRRVAGTQTVMVGPTNFSFTANDVVKCRAVGTTVTGYQNGVSQATITDANVASGLRGGVVMVSRTGAATATALDNFVSQDVAGAVVTRQLMLLGIGQ